MDLLLNIIEHLKIIGFYNIILGILSHFSGSTYSSESFIVIGAVNVLMSVILFFAYYIINKREVK